MCTLLALTACGSPTSSVVAVPGQADLNVAGPQHTGAPAEEGTGNLVAGVEDELRNEPSAATALSSEPSSSRTSAAGADADANRPSQTPASRTTRLSAPLPQRTGLRRASRVSPPGARVTTGPARQKPPRPAATAGLDASPTKVTGSPGSLSLVLGTGSPTADEADVIRLVNIERVAAGCPALTPQPLLMQVARGHSQAMSGPAAFKHNSPDGRTPFQRLTAVGYRYLVAGEIIAAGQPTPAAVLEAWMNSPDHRQNILDCRFTQIGVGKAFVAGSQYGTYWTQELAVPM
ncbi:MAG: hypothetical protein QG622_2232 [Actinomycetota bacterium]|nr:hypothetical protein [Actinomycetota bacterium]